MMKCGALALAAAVVLSACSSPSEAEETAPTTTPSTAPVDSTTSVDSTTTTSSVTSTTTTTSTAPEDAMVFESRVAEVVDPDTEASTWRPGCPVAIEDLRVLTVSYWDADGEIQQGQLVVRFDHAAAVVGVFNELFDARFPIERMDLIDIYAGDDNASMRANNTSAFNCREIDGQPGVWSDHASGAAIDINPLVNPWVRSDGQRVDPPEGQRYADRTLNEPGMIVAGDVVTQAFASAGWTWGGDWAASKDYQHFSASGS